jgi:pimeloyl-ACP methyl ester carboxylesterase
MTTPAVHKTPADTAYRVAGKGSPLILIHGVGLDSRVWAPQIADFSQDHRVIAYDTLGHGASRLPPQGARLPDYIDQLSALIKALDLPPAILIGHSMGALIALGHALAHPDSCRAVVALNAVYDRTAEHRARSLRTAELLAAGKAGALLDGTLARWFDDADRADPGRGACVAQIRNRLAAADPEGYARAYRVFAEDGDAFVGRLGQLRQPALFVTAEGDPNSTPAMSHAMAAAVPRGAAAIVSGERHMLPAIAPEKVDPLIRRFLGQLDETAMNGPKGDSS